MNTKKIILSLGFLTTVFLSSAQEFASPGAQSSVISYNSLNFSQTNPVLGTARYSGMAGAMGALGADASTMRDNPAGLGVYRSSDITITPNFSIANDNSVGFNINNFGLVLNFKNSGNRRGYVTSSVGISYNRLKNFRRFSDLGDAFTNFSMTNYMTQYAADKLYSNAQKLELINENGSLFGRNEQFSNQTRYSGSGSISEWNFAYGLNISNRFYFGISTGFVNLDYNTDILYDEWIASAPNLRGNSWQLDNYYEASGSGFNFKFGAIAAPADFIRIGVAFHTPTFYNIDERYEEKISRDNYFDLPSKASYISDLQTPLKLQGSLGFILGKRAILGLEYQYEDFTAMRFSSDGILHQGSKNLINNEMKITHTAKAGAEVRIIDGLSLRAGFAFVSTPSTELNIDIYADPQEFQPYPLVQPQNTFYYTGGIGYKGKSFYADLAYVHQVQEETFFPYLPQEEFRPYELKLHNSNITATLGFRF